MSDSAWVPSPMPNGLSPENCSEPVQSSPGRADCRCESSRLNACMSDGEPKACCARASSSARWSGLRLLRKRWAAAARLASESSSSSTLRGFSGKNSPCLSMKSSKSCWVSSPRACLSSSSLRSSTMSVTRCRSSSVAPCSASFMPAKRWSSISRPSKSLIWSYFSRASALRQLYSDSSCTALAGDAGSASSCNSPNRASSSSARASSLRSASTASSSSFLISCKVPSKLFLRNRSRRRRFASAASRSAPGMFLVPRRSNSDRARRGEVPAMTSCPICSSASRRSTGGASGSGPPVYAE